MGKGEQNWPRLNQEPPKSLLPTSNTLFPDRQPTPRNNYGPVDNMSSGNRPPWQANRGDFGNAQIPRPMTPPWRDARFDSRLKDSKGWSGVRQNTPYNPQNIRTNSIGWSKPDENIPQWRKPDPVRMDMRGNGPNDPWNDRPAAGEGRGGYFPKGINESAASLQGPPKLNLEDRFRGGPPSQKWTPNLMDKDPHWFDRMDKPDWNEKPVRHPDWRERSQEMGPFESKGPMNMNRLNEDTGWRRPSNRPLNDPWNVPRRQPESLIKVGNLARDSNNRDWGNRPRNFDDLERSNRPMVRQEGMGYWRPPGPAGEPEPRNIFNEPGNIPARGEQNFPRNSGPVGGPFSEREFSRKRPRSPENRNVWNRLEPQALLNELPAAKILRACDQLDSGIGKDVLAMIERERMDLNFPKPAPPTPLIEQQPRPPNKDLRLKLTKRDVPAAKGQTQYKVCIVPHFKKSRFQLRNKDQFFDKLISDLYKMAKSDDMENLPQLRFHSFTMETKTRLTVQCHDAVTAKWLLNWDHGDICFSVRKILPEDPLHLAVIGFDVKGICDVNTDSMKFYLKIQNPGLDINCWRDGQIKTSKKGKMYLYKVDGHTLRYLVHNKWELFFDMQRLFVKHFRTNFNYNPQTFALI